MPYDLQSSCAPVAAPRESPAGSALSATHAVASVGIATLKMLETLLPVAANEVEKESSSLSMYFIHLIENAQTQNSIIERLVELHGSGSRHDEECRLLSQQARQASSKLKTATDGVVTCMQFQDRNTQIMHNVAGILERYRSMLEDICDNINMMQDERALNSYHIDHAVKEILSGIGLSDIRTRYLDALNKAKVPMHDSFMSYGHSDSSADNIELF